MESVHSQKEDQDNNQITPVSGPHAAAHNIQVVCAYLSKHIPEYRELVELRKEGWSNPSPNTHFQNERSHADNPSDEIKDRFYRMTCQVGNELDICLGSGIISLPFLPRRSIPVLDLCMAPGGFSTTVLASNPHHDVKIHGVTLPVSLGGYEVRIPNWRSDPRIADIQFLDVTMLASEIGIPSEKIPTSHPDQASFITNHVFPKQQNFDIIFCGGTVVRNHRQNESYQSYRQQSEGTRLHTSQLAIAMNRIRPGGTMVILLHKADAWTSVVTMHTFSKFSDVNKMRLFKPARAHARKGSFYLVVTGVDPDRVEAKEAVEGWRRDCMSASMLDMDSHVGGDSSYQTKGNDNVSDTKAAEAMMEEFVPQLVQLARPVFMIQANALRTAPWNSSSAKAG